MGDVVASGAVAAGGGVFEISVFVVERNRDTIDFGFEGDGDIFSSEIFLEATVKGNEFGFWGFRIFEFEDIIDAEHSDGMCDLGESFEGFGTDALGGRV